MPRTARAIKAGLIYHVINRGNGRMRLFHKDEDYAAFEKVLVQAMERHAVDLLTYCLMPNHWHLVLRPGRDDALGRFMGWVGVTHVRRHHAHYQRRGGGHLYQGRYKSFPVQDDLHFLTLCRYVEANAHRAGLVDRAEDWPWNGLACRGHRRGHHRGRRAAEAGRPSCCDWPVARPANWLRHVNRPLAKEELDALRTSVNRGRPWGDDAWVRKTADALGLTFTLRDPGRPRKTPDGRAGVVNE